MEFGLTNACNAHTHVLSAVLYAPDMFPTLSVDVRPFFAVVAILLSSL
jgi:hypothetical protein